MTSSWLANTDPKTHRPVNWDIPSFYIDHLTKQEFARRMSSVADQLGIDKKNIDSIMSMLRDAPDACRLLSLIKASQSWGLELQSPQERSILFNLLHDSKVVAKIEAAVADLAKFKGGLKQMGVSLANIDVLIDIARSKPNPAQLVNLLNTYKAYLATGDRLRDALFLSQKSLEDMKPIIVSLVASLKSDPEIAKVEQFIRQLGLNSQILSFYLEEAKDRPTRELLVVLGDYLSHGLTDRVISVVSAYIEKYNGGKRGPLEAIIEHRKDQAEKILSKLSASPDMIDAFLHYFPQLEQNRDDFKEWIAAKSDTANPALRARLLNAVNANVQHIEHWGKQIDRWRSVSESGLFDNLDMLQKFLTNSHQIDPELRQEFIECFKTEKIEKSPRFFNLILEKFKSLKELKEEYKSKLVLYANLSKIPAYFPGFPPELKNGKIDFGEFLTVVTPGLARWIENAARRTEISDVFYDESGVSDEKYTWDTLLKNPIGEIISPFNYGFNIQTVVDKLVRSGQNIFKIDDCIYTLSDIKRTLLSISRIYKELRNEFESKHPGSDYMAPAYLSHDLLEKYAQSSGNLGKAAEYLLTMGAPLFAGSHYNFGSSSFLQKIKALIDDASRVWSEVEPSVQDLAEQWVSMFGDASGLSLIFSLVDLKANFARYDMDKNGVISRNELQTLVDGGVEANGYVPVSALGALARNDAVFQYVETCGGTRLDDDLIGLDDLDPLIEKLKSRLSDTIGQLKDVRDGSSKANAFGELESIATMMVNFDLLAGNNSAFDIRKENLQKYIGCNSALDAAIKLYTSGSYLAGQLDEGGWANLNSQKDGLASWDDLASVVKWAQFETSETPSEQSGELDKFVDQLFNQVLQSIADGSGEFSSLAKDMLNLKQLRQRTIGGIENGTIRNQTAAEQLLADIQERINGINSNYKFKDYINNQAATQFPALSAAIPKLQEKVTDQIRLRCGTDYIKNIFEENDRDAVVTLQKISSTFENYALFLDPAVAKRLRSELMCSYQSFLIDQSFAEALFSPQFSELFDPSNKALIQSFASALSRPFGWVIATDVAVLLQRALRIASLQLRDINNNNNIELKSMRAKFDKIVIDEFNKGVTDKMAADNEEIGRLRTLVNNGLATDDDRRNLAKLKLTYDCFKKRVEGMSGAYKHGFVHLLSGLVGVAALSVGGPEGKWDKVRILNYVASGIITSVNLGLFATKLKTERALQKVLELNFNDGDAAWDAYKAEHDMVKDKYGVIEGAGRICVGVAYALLATASLITGLKNLKEDTIRSVLEFINCGVNALSFIPPMLEGGAQIYKSLPKMQTPYLASDACKTWYIRLNNYATIAQIIIGSLIMVADHVKDQIEWTNDIKKYKNRTQELFDLYFKDVDIWTLCDPDRTNDGGVT